ncbi:MAG: histidine kinase [Candidatus Parabeggiatoa sp. nov. 3]|nr:MAG: histidine kinase [Gammaproteobacteria bacterium]
MRIRSKLLINTLVTIVCLAVLGGIGFFYIHYVAQTSLLLVEMEAEPILKINELEELASEKWLRLIVHSGISDVETMQQLEQEMGELNHKINEQIQSLDEIYTRYSDVEANKHLKHLQIFKKNWQQFEKIAQQVLLLSQDFTKEDALQLIIQEGRVAYDKAISNLRDLIKQHRQNMETLRDAALQARQQSLWAIVIFTVLIGISLLFFTNRFIGRSLLAPLLSLNQHLKALALGKLVDDEIIYSEKNEMAEIIQSAQQLKNSMNNTIKQANAIATGDYHQEVILRCEHDQLGYALSEMTQTLRQVTTKNEVQDWFKTGQTQLHDQMSGDLTLVDLAHNIVSFVTLYLEGQIGICYLVEHTVEGLNQTFRLKQVASYAYTRRKNMGDEFEFSVGLIERAAKGQESIHITINAGLGEEMPRHLLMIPFLHETVVKGVIVLGSLNPLTDNQIEWLNQVMPSIGIAMNSVESRTKLQELLQKTQNQAKTLESQKAILQGQTEELQHQKEELQNQSEELQSQTEELQTQQEELRQTNDELEERTRELERQKEAIRQKNQALEKSQQAIQIKADELELASQYKSDFLANMSHELRTPLNSLLILAQLLADNKADNLNDKQIEYAKTIHSAGSDLLKLINDILDLSKVEAGKMAVHIENLSLTDFVDNLEHQFRHVAEKKAVDFHITLAEDLPSAINTDVQKLQQIIKNLLSNAFKFTREGEIKLTLQKSKSTITPIFQKGEAQGAGEDWIAISVSDTGIGIPKDKQQIIFEAFQQVDGTTSRRYGGTGLGLSISRQLARLLRGDIQVSSEAEQGSTFTLYLPERVRIQASGVQELPPESGVDNSGEMPQNSSNKRSDFQETSSPINDTQIAQIAHEKTEFQKITDDRENLTTEDKTLLIIEDDHKFSSLLMEIAQEKHFKCLVAQDGKTGLQLAVEYQPNAIILDVGLPELDGWTVMERLKDNPETRHIPVHFVSGSDHEMTAKKMGAIGYLLKPVNMEQLGEAFQKIEQFISTTVKNLLIVVDNDAHQQQMLELIRSDDIQITLATTKAMALKQLEETAFDCQILDIDVEQRSGIKLIEQIVQQKALRQTPLILYADRELSAIEEGLLLQCEEHITIKSVRSPVRLLDEATLFLHQVEAKLPEEKRKMLRMVHDKAAILTNKKVLIVDDDTRNVFALATVLEDNDMEVVCGQNGKEGIALLEEEDDIDLILMDIMMPEMDGYEAMRKIRAQVGFRKLPIIALTAKAMKGDKAKCIEAGANDYLTKPVDTDKLISLMRVWLYR